jgi:hypothetical protein
VGGSMSSVVISGDTSGAITLSAPAVSGTNTITLPASTGTVVTTGTPASGNVIQVVNQTTTTSVSVSNTTWTDTTLTATITPKFSTSKILVLISQNGMGKAGTDISNDMTIQLLRGATVIAKIASAALNTYPTALTMYGYSCSASYLDSPATTSATTYKTQFQNTDGTTAVIVQRQNENSMITLLEIAA